MGQGRRRMIWAVAAVCSGAGCGTGGSVGVPARRECRGPAGTGVRPHRGTGPDRRQGADRAARGRQPVRPADRADAPSRSAPWSTRRPGRSGLTSANPGTEPARPESSPASFFRGIFRVEQSRSAGGLVDLAIRDNVARSACTARPAHTAALSPRVLGLLRGVAKGRFRTTGQFSAATVRGTDWGVRDRCDGTLTVVRRGRGDRARLSPAQGRHRPGRPNLPGESALTVSSATHHDRDRRRPRGRPAGPAPAARGRGGPGGGRRVERHRPDVHAAARVDPGGRPARPAHGS